MLVVCFEDMSRILLLMYVQSFLKICISGKKLLIIIVVELFSIFKRKVYLENECIVQKVQSDSPL